MVVRCQLYCTSCHKTEMTWGNSTSNVGICSKCKEEQYRRYIDNKIDKLEDFDPLFVLYKQQFVIKGYDWTMKRIKEGYEKWVRKKLNE